MNLDEPELLLELFDEAPVYLTIVEGPEFQAVMANRKVRESWPEWRGKRIDDIYPEDNPLRAVLERVYTTGVAETVHDHPTYFRDGQHAGRYFTRSFVALRERPGQARRILVTVTEVTEEVRARHATQAELQRLFALLEEAPVLINVLEGPDLRIVMMNRRSRELLAGRVTVGMKFRELVLPDNGTLTTALRVFATGVPETFETVSRDLESFVGRSFTTTVVPIREPDGNITRILTASLETTEQQRAREVLETQARDLELARREAVEAGRAKDQFLAMLGHELRDPLAPMLTALQVMRFQGASGSELDILERQVRHLTRLVNDLLDISRVTRGLVTLNRRDVKPATIVNRALEMSSPLLEQRNHRVVTDIGHSDLVSGDPDRLAQVVANLISNAAKYSEPGSQIRITSSRSGDHVKLSVSDDGIGIAPDMLERVFDAFVQQPQTLARSEGGLGLGLAIVKSLVEAHGGTVSACSEGLGRGSTFVVELPALAVQPVASDESSVPFARPEPHLTSSPQRILVVDDNRDAADILRIALGARGHAITVAYDGPSALASAARQPPQLALIDIGLPVMDGYQLAAILRATYNIPVVAITGYGQRTDHQRSAAAGFAAHLVKPVDFGELALLVERLSTRA